MNEENEKQEDKFLDEEFDFSRASKGPIVSAKGVKLPVSIRLDSEVIDFFKKQAEEIGGKARYQSLINEALKEYVAGANIKNLLLSDEFIKTLSDNLKKSS